MRVSLTPWVLTAGSAVIVDSVKVANWIKLFQCQDKMNAEEGNWKATFIYSIFIMLKYLLKQSRIGSWQSDLSTEEFCAELYSLGHLSVGMKSLLTGRGCIPPALPWWLTRMQVELKTLQASLEKEWHNCRPDVLTSGCFWHLSFVCSLSVLSLQCQVNVMQ